MNSLEQNRFDGLCERHLRALKLHGMSDNKAIDAIARAVRRISQSYDRCPGRLSSAR